MNRFGEIADELTDLIEELDHSDLAGIAGPLRLALERAFARACEAERRARLAEVPVARRRKQVNAVVAAIEPQLERHSALIIPFADRRRAIGG